jgi:hypothetical protein
MGMIRQYMEASGDPFSLRVPKRFRKMKLGRSLGRLAGGVAGFLPGVGTALSFARDYGLMAGDPKGPKRKQAASGPKAKAKRKQAARHERASGAHVSGAAKRRGMGHGHIAKGMGGLLTGLGQAAGSVDWSQVLTKTAGGVPIVGAGIEDALEQARGAGGAMANVVPIALPGGGVGHALMPHRRRKTRVINVTALNRAAGRIQKFEKLVHRLTRKGPLAHARPHKAHRGGHKAGCRCVACKHR